MSGIVGIYFLDGRPVNRAELQGMVDILAHRGPDGAGVWHQGPVGLGHRMLWTTPESLGEKLPLAGRTGDLVITAEARIDNREELFSALDFSGRKFGEVADSELILAAYEKWGERCPEQLLGDFAFAILDNNRHLLFCARSPMGIKPFYYFFQPHKIFVFASEIKALLCHREVPRRLNETRVADFLCQNFEDQAITFYQDIWRLPSGHSLTVMPGKVNPPRPYWSLDPHKELKLNSDAEYAECFRVIFTEAVRCRLRSAFPVGVCLSGGLDSSSIACVARNLLKTGGSRRLKTFSAIYDEVPESDERFFINAVLAQGEVEPNFVHVDKIPPFADIERLFWHEDEPFWIPNLFMWWQGLYPAAAGQGVRVLLDGLEGDIAVSRGEAYLTELACRGRWQTLLPEATALARHMETSALRVLWLHCLKPLLPSPVIAAWMKLKQLRGLGSLDIINRDFARNVRLRERQKRLTPVLPRTASLARALHWLNLTGGVEPMMMEIMDKAAVPHGLELRHPFYDRRLLEFCLALPPEQTIKGGWNRMIMRRAFAHLLPPEVCWRSWKGNLSHNFFRGLLILEPRRLDRFITGNLRELEKFIDLSKLRFSYRKFVIEHCQGYGLNVWQAMVLGLWLELGGVRLSNEKRK